MTGQYRMLRIVLARFSQATGLLMTLPVVKMNGVAGTLEVFVGYAGRDLTTPMTLSANVINVLADYLSRLFGLTVRLSLVKIDNHFSDATLMAQYLSALVSGGAQTSHTFKAVMLRLAKFMAFTTGNTSLGGSKTPSILKGLRVRVSGRLTTEPTRPRQTVQGFTMGSFTSNRIQASSHTAINAKGTITVKVWLAM